MIDFNPSPSQIIRRIFDTALNAVRVSDLSSQQLVTLKFWEMKGLTITQIEEAIHWQDARTKDRENRKVEGKNEV